MKARNLPRAPARSLVRSALITAQVAFSYMLLIGAGLMVNSLIQLQRVDPGFVPQHVFAVGVDLNFTKYPDSQSQRVAARRLLERIQPLPGVLSAAVSSSFPMDADNQSGGGRSLRFRAFGDNRPDTEMPPVQSGPPRHAGLLPHCRHSARRRPHLPRFRYRRVSPCHPGEPSLARRTWKNEDAVGKRITFDGEHFMEIVGVVGDVREFGPREDAPVQLYRPMAQDPFAGNVLVRTAADPELLIPAVRRAVLEANPESAVVKVKTLDEARSEAVASPRTTAQLFGLFAALALVIAVAGIGSMLALWVRQRMREIGIRIALGAAPSDILSTVLRQGMVLVARRPGLRFRRRPGAHPPAQEAPVRSHADRRAHLCGGLRPAPRRRAARLLDSRTACRAHRSANRTAHRIKASPSIPTEIVI